VPPEDPRALANVIEQAIMNKARCEPGMKALYQLFDVRESAARLLRDLETCESEKINLKISVP
jgi:hypothetical protein